mgnify:CR=1 FL=1
MVWSDALEGRLLSHLADASARVARHYETTKSSEHPLVTQAELRALGVPFAILTGRSPHELEDAFTLLGFRCEAVCDSALHLAKPRPAGLLQLADAFRATEIVFVGDTKDDRTALERAAALRPETHFRFAAVGPDRGSFARIAVAVEGADEDADADLEADTLREILSMQMFRTPKKEADS